MFRTMVIEGEDEALKIYFLIRSSPRWFAAILDDEGYIDTEDELMKYQLNDSKRDSASMPGPLLRWQSYTFEVQKQ